MEEVYLHLVESGVLLDEHGRVHSDLQLEVLLPESIRLVLGQRLDRLATATCAVLVAAAVSGRMFTSRSSARLPARARTGWSRPSMKRSAPGLSPRQGTWGTDVQPRAHPPDAAIRRLCCQA